MILKTHTKFYPAEHHAQSAIEAAISIRPDISGKKIRKIILETFDVAVEIIGSEKEKWAPATRETADHSMPYLVVAALLDGDVNLAQFRKKKFKSAGVRKLLKKVEVKSSRRYSRLYPRFLPNKVTVICSDGSKWNQEVLLSKGYAGRPMTNFELEHKFQKLVSPLFSNKKITHMLAQLWKIDRRATLNGLF